MRKIRYVPKSQTLVHITCRTIQGRYLFRPGPQFNDLFLGALGKAQRDCEVKINLVSALSSHFHLLLTVDDAQQAAPCMAILRPCPSGSDSLSQVVPGAP